MESTFAKNTRNSVHHGANGALPTSAKAEFLLLPLFPLTRVTSLLWSKYEEAPEVTVTMTAATRGTAGPSWMFYIRSQYLLHFTGDRNASLVLQTKKQTQRGICPKFLALQSADRVLNRMHITNMLWEVYSSCHTPGFFVSLPISIEPECQIG